MTTNDNRLATRRRILLTGATATLALAGCLGDDDGTGTDDNAGDDTTTDDTANGENGDDPGLLPVVEDPPDAVYHPTHHEAFRMLPTVEAGDYALLPHFTYPHRFWLMRGDEREEVLPTRDDRMHLMLAVWDRETGEVLPVGDGTEMLIEQDGELIERFPPWPMISQEMGFHFGDNVPLPGDGTYSVEVRLSPLSDTVRKTGSFEGRFTETVTATFELDYSEQDRVALVGDVEFLDEALWGEPGALELMDHGDMHGHGDGMSNGDGMNGSDDDMDGHGDGHDGDMDGNGDGHDDDMDGHGDGHDGDMDGNGDGHDDDMDGHGDGHDMDGGPTMPSFALPPADEYPGTDLGTPASGDATFVVRYLSESRLSEGDDGYLLVSPRTPYNRIPLPNMALSITNGHDRELIQTLDDELGLHYGTSVTLSPGEEFDLVVESPPQVARHQGYETAFIDMPPMTIEVPE